MPTAAEFNRRILLGGAAALLVTPAVAYSQTPDLEALAADPTRSASREAVTARGQAAKARAAALTGFQTTDAETALLVCNSQYAAQCEARLADFPYGDGSSVYPVTYRSGQHGRGAKADLHEIRFETLRIDADTQNGVWQSVHLLRRALLAVEAACTASEGEVRRAFEAQHAALTRQLGLSSDLKTGVLRHPKGTDYAHAQFGLALGADVSPQDMLKAANSRLDAIWKEADTILKAQGLKSGSASDRFQHFVRDPRHLYPHTEDGKNKLVADMNKVLADSIAALPKAFDALAIPPTAVIRMTPEEEANGTQGKRSSTNYVIDLRRVRDRPSWTLTSVVHHELYPGHMLQTLTQPPKIAALRSRYGNVSGEGWAVYAETVAAEQEQTQGLARLGFLQWQAFRYARIVVDIGLHFQGWSRDKAIAELKRLQGGPIYFITLEEDVDRMCLSPGVNAAQGFLALDVAAQRAQREKLPGFDLKAFHRAVLSRGPFTADGMRAAV